MSKRLLLAALAPLLAASLAGCIMTPAYTTAVPAAPLVDEGVSMQANEPPPPLPEYDQPPAPELVENLVLVVIVDCQNGGVVDGQDEHDRRRGTGRGGRYERPARRGGRRSSGTAADQ